MERDDIIEKLKEFRGDLRPAEILYYHESLSAAIELLESHSKEQTEGISSEKELMKRIIEINSKYWKMALIKDAEEYDDTHGKYLTEMASLFKLSNSPKEVKEEGLRERLKKKAKSNERLSKEVEGLRQTNRCQSLDIRNAQINLKKYAPEIDWDFDTNTSEEEEQKITEPIRELVRGIFGDEAASDNDIVNMYIEANKTALESLLPNHKTREETK